MFLIYIWIMLSFGKISVLAHDNFLQSDDEVLTNISVSAFLDAHRNIRLNISWTNSSDTVKFVSIRFIDSDDCNPIDGVNKIPVKEISSLVIPPLTLVHPADDLLNGCEYEMLIETDDMVPNLSQSLHYEIPDCVQDKCKCGNSIGFPYKIDSIVPLYKDSYFLKWSGVSNINQTIYDITYMREDNNASSTRVLEENVSEEGAEVLLPDIKEGVRYRINVQFTYDGCHYVSGTTLFINSKNKFMFVIVGLMVMIATMVLITIFIMCSPNLSMKIKKYVFCWNEETLEDFSRPISLGVFKEEVNPQYTPLKFLLKNYDKYEFPRNKVIIKEIIGSGAFGVVYFGEAFELCNDKGYTKIAIKQLRHGASDEEKTDLLNEIKILKKVGEHPNIVKLLGCVTIDQPYMMLLELVPCGSLDKYLKKLREKWKKRRSRFFFNDDIPGVWNTDKFIEQEPNTLKYTKVVFENDEYYSRNSDGSYIQPDNLLEELSTSLQNVSNNYLPEKLKRISVKSMAPQSPISFASSGLPSCADTEITLISSEASTPLETHYTNHLEPELNNTELQNFALQIAKGMEYLEKIKVTHRDLAARNILMTSDKKLKISDFGLSRVGTYVSSVGKKLPLRWMAIEAIQNKVCDNKTDVWSFAVVLWEIGTLGAFPYQKTDNDFILHDLKLGKRLERPIICTDELYTLMLNCWSENPQDRPTFGEIVKQLDTKRIYDDFSKLSPTYVFPPTKGDSESV